MPSLYELNKQYQEVLDMLYTDVPEVVVLDTLEMLEGEIEEKADNYAKIIKQLEADCEALKKEAERLAERRAALENRIRTLKLNLEQVMRDTGKTKFKTLMFSFYIQANPPSVVIDDNKPIPPEYLVPQPPKVDKKKIKEDLQNGVKLDFAKLEQTEGLRIR